MKSLVVDRVTGSARHVLALFVALVAIGSAFYLYGHPFGRVGMGCRYSSLCVQNPYSFRETWQLPVAVLVGLLIFGAALAVAGRRRRPLFPSAVPTR